MKFITSEYEPNTGVSMVKVKHRNRIFVGTSAVHPDDKAYASTYTGGAIAEIRANIKALKYELRVLKKETKEWTKFLNACTNCKKFDKESDTAKVVYRQYNKQLKKIERVKQEIEFLKEQEVYIIDIRAKYIEKRIKEAEDKAKEINQN